MLFRCFVDSPLSAFTHPLRFWYTVVVFSALFTLLFWLQVAFTIGTSDLFVDVVVLGSATDQLSTIGHYLRLDKLVIWLTDKSKDGQGQAIDSFTL